MVEPGTSDDRSDCSRVAIGIGVVVALAALAFYLERLPAATTAEGIFLPTAYVFSEVKWSAFAVVELGWALLLLLRADLRQTTISLSWLDLAVGAFSSYTILSVIWTPDLKVAQVNLAHIGVVLASYVLARLTYAPAMASILRVAAVVGLGGILLLWVLADEAVEGGLGNSNFAAETCAIFVAVALSFASLRSTWGAWLSHTIVFLAILFLVFGVDANLQFLALVFGLVYLLAAWGRWRIFAGLVSIGAVASMGVLVWVAVSPGAAADLPVNVRDRLQIWTGSVVMAFDEPIAGRGVGSYFHDAGGYVNAYTDLLPSLGTPAYRNYERQPDSSDNDLLDVWVELGLIGVILSALVLAAAFYSALRRSQDSLPRLLGAALAVGIGASLVSGPLQTPASIMILSLVAGFIGRTAPVAGSRQGQSTRISYWVGVTACLIVSAGALTMLIPQTLAGVHVSRALAIQRTDSSKAAQAALKANSVSDMDARGRILAYTQTMIAGPSFWSSQGLRRDDLETLYENAASASPKNPLLIDLRLKQTLSDRGREVNLDEVESMLSSFKKSIGRFEANPHVLEAALAIQIGDRRRAREALIQARALADGGDANDRTNLQNIRSLEKALE